MNKWSENIRKVVPYIPGEQPNQPNMVKLNTNENPYPPTPKVQKILRELEINQLKLYPDPNISKLVNALADYHSLKPEQVFVGVGSDDVLAIAFMTFFNSNKPIVFPDITYSFYSVWADLFKIEYTQPKLNEDFRINPLDYYSENGGVIFPNPNAPTGVYENLEKIKDILTHNQDVIVIIDEAYIDFGGDSALALINEYDNLLVVRTFSKSRSMAGTRIGYAIGHKDLIQSLNDVKFSFNSYTMNMMSIELGVASIEDDQYFRENIHKIIETRQRTADKLKVLGFEFQDSYANFIFAKHKTVHAKDIFEKLRENNIYVRYFNVPRIDNYLRITIGTEEEMVKMVTVLEEFLKK